MIYKFESFLNENLLKGKSQDDIISKLNDTDIISATVFKQLLKTKIDFDLLPRNNDGYITIEGNLRLGTKHIKNDLPDNLIINGDLVIINGGLNKLPDRLKIFGDLEIDECQLSSLPNNLEVGGNLYMVDNNISEIPPETKVKGYIYAARNQLDIDKAPKHLKFYIN